MTFLLESNILLVLVLLHACSFAATNATLLETECRKTQDPEFCLHVFGSDPATRAASSLAALAHIAVDKATRHAGRTREDIKVRSFFSREPRERNVLSYCMNDYDEALAALEAAAVSLRRELYIDLFLRASMAQRAAAHCEHMLIRNSLQSPVTGANVQFGEFCDIVIVVANDLCGNWSVKKLYILDDEGKIR